MVRRFYTKYNIDILHIQVEVEVYSFFFVGYAEFFSVGVHAGCDDGEADAAAAVFSGAGFVYFVEFDPEFFEFFFRDLFAFVVYVDAYVGFVVFEPYADEAAGGCVVEGVAEVVAKYFFDHEFVGPDADGSFFVEFDGVVIFLNQYLG